MAAHGDTQMVNEHYDPGDDEQTVLGVLEEQHRANPYLIREETGLSKQRVNAALDHLTTAGWAKKVTRGLYEFVADPRSQETDDGE